jgi:hypothetical protein
VSGRPFVLRWRTAIAHGDLRALTKLVALILVEWMDVDGYCWPSQTSIAELANVSLATVKRAIRELKQAGLLRVRSGCGRNGTCAYQAVIASAAQPRRRSETGSVKALNRVPQSYELGQLGSARSAEAARGYVETCFTCGERFTATDEAETDCEACRGGVGQ